MSGPQRKSDTIIREWVARELGGTVTAVSTQPRWRPHWFIDVDLGGEGVRMLVRGDRVDTDVTFPLAHEMRFQKLLHQGGIPVPAIHGWIDELPAFVSGCAPGRPDFSEVNDAERDRIVDEYLAALVAIHSLDIGPFVDAGIVRAPDPSGSAMIGMHQMEAVYRRFKAHPNPFMEFGLGWVRRHQPKSHGRETPVVWDSGQLHHEGGHMTAVLDVELGHLGDPMMDLAGWRMRDSVLHFGDYSSIYARYERLRGEPVDLEAIELHHIAFTLSNALSFSHTLIDPPPETDFATNLQWCNETNLFATEAIAEHMGVELPTVEPIEARHSRVAPAYAHLARSLRSIETDDDYLRHQLRINFRLARHLLRFDEIGDAAVTADLDDLQGLLGHRPETWHDGQEQLERFVLADAGEGRHDEALVELFHRQNLRAQMLNGPEGSAMARHNPTQTMAATRAGMPAARGAAGVDTLTGHARHD